MKEGIRKYNLHYEPEEAPCPELVGVLNPLRDRLYSRDLLGVDPQGIGQGNISSRKASVGPHLPGREGFAGPFFLITGTGSSRKKRLSDEDYVLVTECDFGSFSLHARGPVAPSSEAFTHGAVYLLDERIRFVIHVHHMGLWHLFLRSENGTPSTGDAEYGTFSMVRKVFEIYGRLSLLPGRGAENSGNRPGTGEMEKSASIFKRNYFVMPNHEGGIVAFGRTPEEAERPLYEGLAML